MGTRGSRSALVLLCALLLWTSQGAARPCPYPRASGSYAREPHQGEGWDRAQVVLCAFLGEPLDETVPDRIVVKRNPVTSKAPLFELYFISGWPSAPRTVLVYPARDYFFLDAFSGGPDLLVTEWSAGDRPLIEVFQLVADGAKVVYEESARGGFEYWGNVILRSNAAIGPDGNYHATTTQLWQWNGKQYKLAATVPYGQRLEALAKLEREAKRK